MCTVTFLPTATGYCLTSNRDEKCTRLPALPPAIYRHGNRQLLYPKDATAGGTWIAATPQGNVAVLLNGGFVPHTSPLPYRHSRGRVITDLLQTANPVHSLQHYPCNGIEPFTLVLYTGAALYECRWTGTVKHLAQLDATRPHIWSSATLYSGAVALQREAWFQNWLQACPQPAQQQVVQFHRGAGNGDAANDLCMNRNGETRTVSITSVAIDTHQVRMQYLNIITGSLHLSELQIPHSTSPVLYSGI